MRDDLQPPSSASAPGSTSSSAGAPRLVSRLLSRETRRQLTSIAARDRLQQVAQVNLLAQEGLRDLARLSLYLLLGSGLAYIALDLVARSVRHSGPLLGTGPAALRGLALVAANIVAYVVVLPLHEALHGATILALGGRPRFGLKLPLAAYCTAPGQLFTRNGYLAVALAPLLVLSILGAVATWLVPDLGACIILALAGNVSGAVGDLKAVSALLRLPSSALISDTETGYQAFLPAE